MNWTYDGDVDALYIELASEQAARQIEIGPGAILDVSGTGALVGIELLGDARFPLSVLDDFSVAPLGQKFVAGVLWQANRSALVGESVVTQSVSQGELQAV